MTRIITFIAAVALVIAGSAAVTSCHTSRQSTASTQYNATGADTWSTVRMPVKVNLEQPMGMSFSGRATMVRDSSIHVSMRVLGMEVAVAYVNTDSLYFLDKYHKYVFGEPLHTILGPGYSGLTLGQMQQILLGQRDSGVQGITLQSPTPTPGGEVAGEITFDLHPAATDITGSLEWNTRQAQWDQHQPATFKIPAGYKRLTLPAMLRAMKSM